jgi:uncharacterized membrane protein YfcA
MGISDLLFYFLTLIAETLGTVGGFGSSVFFVPMASWFYDFQSVLGLTAFYHLFSNFSKIMLFKEGIDKRILITIGVPSVIFVVVGSVLSKYVPAKSGTLILGVFLILFAAILLLKPTFRLAQNNRNSIIGGGLSGFSAGLLGTGGAIRGLTLASFDMGKSTFLATSAMIDMGIDSTRFFVYLSQGYITKEMLWKAPVLLGISLVGSWVGKKVLNKIPQPVFIRISLWLILVIGFVTIYGYFKG